MSPAKSPYDRAVDAFGVFLLVTVFLLLIVWPVVEGFTAPPPPPPRSHDAPPPR